MTKYRRNFFKAGNKFFGAMPEVASQGLLVDQAAALWKAFHHVLAIPSSVRLNSNATRVGLEAPRKRWP